MLVPAAAISRTRSRELANLFKTTHTELAAQKPYYQEIVTAMKVAAAYAIADLIPDNEITADYIIPNPFDERVAKAVAKAVAEAARKTGVARI